MTQLSSAATIGSRATPMKRNRNSVRVDVLSGFGPISNAIILGIILALGGILYITQITKTNSFGYQISTLSQQKNELIDQNQQLELDIARLQSQERLASTDAAKALVAEPEATQFITN